MATSPHTGSHARLLALAGIVLLVAGAWLALSQWPTDVDDADLVPAVGAPSAYVDGVDEVDEVDEGSTAWAAAGLGLLGAGTVVLLGAARAARPAAPPVS